MHRIRFIPTQNQTQNKPTTTADTLPSVPHSGRRRRQRRDREERPNFTAPGRAATVTGKKRGKGEEGSRFDTDNSDDTPFYSDTSTTKTRGGADESWSCMISLCVSATEIDNSGRNSNLNSRHHESRRVLYFYTCLKRGRNLSLTTKGVHHHRISNVGWILH